MALQVLNHQNQKLMLIADANIDTTLVLQVWNGLKFYMVLQVR